MTTFAQQFTFQARDRGQFIREQKEYVGLASQVFATVTSSVRHHLLRISHTHVIVECVR